MTATGTQAPLWVSLAERRPGLGAYEVSHRGKVRSIDRILADGRGIKGKELKAGISGTSPYPQVDLYDAAGKRQTFSVHSLVLLAYAGECPDGQEALHFNDNPLDNRWPENLGYGTHPENVIQRMKNRPAAPKPVKVCARCQNPFEGNGRRCHPCVVAIGQGAADRLAEGMDLEKVAEVFGYPSAVGLWRLAVRYGGAVVVLRPELDAVNRQLQEAAAVRRHSLPHRLVTTLRGRFRGRDAE